MTCSNRVRLSTICRMGASRSSKSVVAIGRTNSLATLAGITMITAWDRYCGGVRQATNQPVTAPTITGMAINQIRLQRLVALMAKLLELREKHTEKRRPAPIFCMLRGSHRRSSRTTGLEDVMRRSNSRNSVRIMVLALVVLAGGITQPWRLLAQAPSAAKGVKFSQISEADMKEWLTYLSSDELQGRQIYTEGYGAAAQYIADHLKAWGVKPIGDNGSYFQAVRMKGYKVTNNSSVTIDGPGGSKTFKSGDHVTFATNAG